MKKIYTILFSFLFMGLSIAQIPNPGFESWVNNDPEGWTTVDILWEGVTQSSDARSGSSAARLEIVSFNEEPIAPLMQAYFPANERYGSLTGYYKFFPQRETDIFSVDIILFQGSSVFNLVGSGSFEIYTGASEYTQFIIPIEYFSDANPDSAWIFILVDDEADEQQAGAYAIVDDLSFGGATAVEKFDQYPSDFSLMQNYPNPFNPVTKIEFSVPEESFIDLKVYDILGEEVASLASGLYSTGSYRVDFFANNLPSGIYIAKFNAVSIKTGISFSKSIKMNLIK